MPSEAVLVRNIMKAIREKYPTAYVRKLADRNSRGIPDIFVGYRRFFEDAADEPGYLFIEAKKPGEYPTLLQEEEHKKIKEAYGEVLVAYSVESVINLLEMRGAI